MSLQSPVFDNIYAAIGVIALLILLLVLLLVLFRRRRSRGAPAAQPTTVPPGAPPIPPPVGVGARPPQAPIGAPGPAYTQPGGRLPPWPGPAIEERPPSASSTRLAGGSPLEAPRVGDPVVAMIASLLDDPAELTDAGLRRLELFKPERVLRAVDDIGQGLSGRGKEAKQARLADIRQYAQSLQVQHQRTPMAEQVSTPPPIPVPPPGSGTEVLPPEAWGVAGEAASAIPLDTELSYLEESFETLDEPAETSEIGFPFFEPGAEPPVSVAAGHASTDPASMEAAPREPSPAAELEPSPAAELEPSPDGMETPEPPPAFPSAPAGPPEPLAPVDAPPGPQTPPLPQAPPAFPVAEPTTFAVREAPSAATSWTSREGITPGGPAEELERPAVVERDTFERVTGEQARPERAGDLRTEELIPLAAMLEETSTPAAPAQAPPLTADDLLALPDAERPAALTRMTPAELGRLQQASDEPGLKLTAIRVLEDLGSPEALGALEGYLDDPDPEVLMQALEAAERMLADLKATGSV